MVKKQLVSFLACMLLLIFSVREAKALCSNAEFIQLASVATGVSPYSPVVGDFNNDGKPDVATANQSSQTISIKLGDGSGGFSGSTALSVGAGFYSIAIGDFNKDGKQDIIAALSASNSVSVFLGNGLGGFTFSSNLSVGSVPYFVVVGDFNNDNNQDIATANYTGATVSVRLGNGVGGFGSVSTITVGTGPYCIGLGDFNSDGKVDMVVPNAISNTVSVRFGDGLGGFTGTTNISITSSPRFIVVDDFNGDGKKDFATANTNSNNVSIRLGDGLGGFSGTTNVTVGAGPFVVKIGDFNGDGIKDLVTTSNLTVNSASILIGNGLGGFTLTRTLTPNNNPTGCAVLDFDSDGYQDIIVTSYDNNNFNVWQGVAPAIYVLGKLNTIFDGSTTIADNISTDFDTASACNPSSRIFEIDNPGYVSLTISNITFTGANASDFSTVGLSFPLTVPNSYLKKFFISFTPGGTGVRTATVHIFSNDCFKSDYDFAIQGVGATPTLGNYFSSSVSSGGNTVIIPSVPPTGTDILTARASSGFTGNLTADPLTGGIRVTNAQPAGTYTITVSEGTCNTRTLSLTVNNSTCGRSQFINSKTESVGFSTSSPSSIAIADLNNDGIQDFVTALSNQNSLAASLGSVSGNFTTNGFIPAVSSGSSVATGDFNRDGISDAVVADKLSNIVSILIGDVTGNFVIGNYPIVADLTVGSNPYCVVVGDFNSDGKQDVASANYGSGNISVLLGTGIGTFTSLGNTSVGTNPYSLAIGDFNADGKQDLAVANYTSNTLSILNGNGSGAFSLSSTVSVGTHPTCVAIGDFNSDGKQDLAVTNNAGNSVSIRLGNGSGGFTGTSSFSVGLSPTAVAIGDFNGDTKQDLAVTNSASNSVSILEGSGTGTFSLSNTLTVGSAPSSLAVSDLNQDGRQDIVVANLSSGSVTVLTGTDNEINLQGNSNSIPDGNTSISNSNNTDFGTTNLCSQVVKSFTIQNTGTSSLIVNAMNFTGANPSDFTILGVTLPLTIASGGNQTFSVKFIPLAAGIRNATIHISNNDCNEADYDFALQGNGALVSLAFNACPLDVMVNAPSGQCRAAVSYTATISASPTPVITYAFTGATSDSGTGTGSGLFFNEGITHVVITATNSCGTGTCTFNITVNANTNDNNACTVDACNTSTGVITNTPININDNDACTVDACNAITGISHTPVISDDGNACTIDACNTITGVSHTPVNPDDGNACTIDGCNSLTGVFHTPATEICGNGLDDDCDGLIDENCNVFLNLELYIQGFYIGNNTMRATVDSSTYPLICDTMGVELHSASSPYNLLYADTALMNIHGESSFVFPLGLIGNSYYIVTKHRNALETWSSGPVLFGSAIVNYSFKDSMQEAYGSNLFDLGDGNFALWSGDIYDSKSFVTGLQDGSVDNGDYNILEQAVNVVLRGYVPQDITGDGVVESLDYSILENARYLMIVSLHP